ncbi:MAG TPA: RidA family protein [Actinomycetota bacterium]
MSAEERLSALGLTLPEPPKAVASYIPAAVTGSTVYVSGQVPFKDGALTRTGLVGRDVDLDDAVADARVCAINVLAHLRAAAGGSLDRVVRMVKVTVFVASSEGFHAQPQVANGASDLFVEVFGDAGRHARAAIGVAALPLGATVEVEAIAELS